MMWNASALLVTFILGTLSIMLYQCFLYQSQGKFLVELKIRSFPLMISCYENGK